MMARNTQREEAAESSSDLLSDTEIDAIRREVAEAVIGTPEGLRDGLATDPNEFLRLVASSRTAAEQTSTARLHRQRPRRRPQLGHPRPDSRGQPPGSATAVRVAGRSARAIHRRRRSGGCCGAPCRRRNPVAPGDQSADLIGRDGRACRRRPARLAQHRLRHALSPGRALGVAVGAPPCGVVADQSVAPPRGGRLGADRTHHLPVGVLRPPARHSRRTGLSSPAAPAN
jgi:hypothetical protein